MRLALVLGLIASACAGGGSNSGDRSGSGGNESGLAKQSCYVGGCSGQLCGENRENLVSTCEWREAYGCYKGAACERQANGQCGWTITASLASCLSAAGETCGGITGKPCTAGSLCVDDPNDDCQPGTGADCGGVCVIGR